MKPPTGPEPFDLGPDFDPGNEQELRAAVTGLLGPTPRPVNWRTLDADTAEQEWYALDDWVDWLRHDYGLPPAIIPPLWHRHPELVWRLSALHKAWEAAYDPQAAAGAPLDWDQKFHLARERLRSAVSASGTRLDRDRPTRQTTWPGDQPDDDPVETPITNRRDDFEAFVRADVERRAAG